MSLLGADGFDHYGTLSANMLLGVYAATSGSAPATGALRNGTHGLRLNATNPSVRRVITQGVQSVLGFGAAYRIPALPVFTAVMLCTWRNGSNTAMVSLCVASTGVLEVRAGLNNGTLLASTSVPVFTAGEFNHIEWKCTFAGASGAVEVRRNGVTVLSATSINIGAAATAAQFTIELATGHGVGGNGMDVDDMFWWNTAGSVNNDFLGDRVVVRLDPTADTAETDWVRNTGSNDFEAIDDAAQDGDTTYIEATTAGDISEFNMTDPGAEVSAVAGLVTYVMQRKTDSGTATTRVSLVSANVGSPPAPAVDDGADNAIGETYGYYQDVFEIDPATGAPWTPSGVAAAKLRLTRVA